MEANTQSSTTRSSKLNNSYKNSNQYRNFNSPKFLKKKKFKSNRPQKIKKAKKNVADEKDLYFYTSVKTALASKADLDIENQLAAFFDYFKLSEADIMRRNKVIFDIKEALLPVFPLVDVVLFGSSETGVADSISDLDISVFCFGNQLKESDNVKLEPNDSKEELFKEVTDILNDARLDSNTTPLTHDDIHLILSARVPVIKLVHFSTNIKCDISFDNYLAARNSELIKFLFQLDARILPLIKIVRYWFKINVFSSKRNLFKSYSLILLIIVYLNKANIIPSLKELRTAIEPNLPQLKINEWDVSFSTNSKLVRKFMEKSCNPMTQYSGLSVIKLARDFFHLYGFFDYNNNVVCSYLGDFLPRQMFDHGNEKSLPDGLNEYKKWCFEKDAKDKLFVNEKYPLVIQDPFLLNFNVGSHTSHNNYLKFTESCKLTSRKLSKMILDIENGKPTNFLDMLNNIEEDKKIIIDKVKKMNKEKKEKMKGNLVGIGSQNKNSLQNREIKNEASINVSLNLNSDSSSIAQNGKNFIKNQTIDRELKKSLIPKIEALNLENDAIDNNEKNASTVSDNKIKNAGTYASNQMASSCSAQIDNKQVIDQIETSKKQIFPKRKKDNDNLKPLRMGYLITPNSEFSKMFSTSFSKLGCKKTISSCANNLWFLFTHDFFHKIFDVFMPTSKFDKNNAADECKKDLNLDTSINESNENSSESPTLLEKFNSLKVDKKNFIQNIFFHFKITNRLWEGRSKALLLIKDEISKGNLKEFETLMDLEKEVSMRCIENSFHSAKKIFFKLNICLNKSSIRKNFDNYEVIVNFIEKGFNENEKGARDGMYNLIQHMMFSCFDKYVNHRLEVFLSGSSSLPLKLTCEKCCNNNK